MGFVDYFIQNCTILALILGLCVIVILNLRIDKTMIITACIGLTVTLLLTVIDYISDYLFTLDKPSNMNYFLLWLRYSLRPIILVLFIYTIDKWKSQSMILLVPAILNAFVYSTCFYGQLTFYISEENVLMMGPLGHFVHFISVFYILIYIVISIKAFRNYEKKYALLLIFCIIIALTAILLEILCKKHNLVNYAIITGCIFYYMFIHIKQTNDTEKESELKLAEQRNQLMLSQIQPHFLYNTLGTIQVLCKTDPELAGHTIKTFARYLRGNIDSVDLTGPIPILDDVYHTKAYVEIEMLRFDNIKVDFDINDKEFFIPALTIQPLVENAIKYGVRIREEGRVKIITYKENDTHYVIIQDNGIGFDVKAIENDGRNHVGIKNVKERIENMVNGELIVESTVGVGTTITIKIKEEM